MKKITKHIFIAAILILTLFLSATEAYADMISPGFIVVGGVILIGAIIFIAGIGLIAWFVVCAIRKRKNKNIIDKNKDVINK
jgi:hypothetical protein